MYKCKHNKTVRRCSYANRPTDGSIMYDDEKSERCEQYFCTVKNVNNPITCTLRVKIHFSPRYPDNTCRNYCQKHK